jgi:hypothetical protein
VGVELPDDALNLSRNGTKVDCAEAAPGDLVFFGDPVASVGVFTSRTDVIQVTDQGGAVQLYPNIVNDSVYGPEINHCARVLTDGLSAAVTEEADEDANNAQANVGPASGPKTVGAVVGGVLASIAVAAGIAAFVIIRKRRHIEMPSLEQYTLNS